MKNNWKRELRKAQQSAIYKFNFGDIVEFTRAWRKTEEENETLHKESVSIDVNDKTVWERNFEGKVPEQVEGAFYIANKKLEEMARKENYSIVLETVKRVAPSWGYNTINKKAPLKIENNDKPVYEGKGKQVYVYFSDEYYKEYVDVFFVEEGQPITFWGHPLWYQDSDILGTEDGSKGYQKNTYCKFDRSQVKNEIEEGLREEIGHGKVVNLTQHPSLPAQRDQGVFDAEEREELRSLLTFTSLPSREEVKERAEGIADIAERYGVCSAMVGGAPYLMAPLEKSLSKRGITPLYAFSVRKSVEKEVDGKVIKTQTFQHLGFVEA